MKQFRWVDDLNDISSEQFKVLSLFSGSGGMDLGFLSTGKFKIVLANDINRAACESYAYNIGDHIIHGDIAQLNDLPDADIVIGGPPCQGFSTANPKRSFDDPRNHLFKEYSRILKAVKPKLFVLENVSGMVTMEKGQVFKLIKKELAACGYRLFENMLNAKDYGVPQNRRRMIIVGVRNDLKVDFNHPLPLRTEGSFEAVDDFLIYGKAPENLTNHKVSVLSSLNRQRLLYIPEGGSMKDVPVDLQNNSDPKRSMRRLSRGKVSHTIVHNNCDHYYHPTEDRRITIREMARIQGYSDEYLFFGSKSEQSKQVGNSVPVGLASAIAIEVLKTLNQIR